MVVSLLNFDDLGVADEIDILAQQEPERGLVERDAILVVEVEVLNGEILAIGNDELLRRAASSRSGSGPAA